MMRTLSTRSFAALALTTALFSLTTGCGGGGGGGGSNSIVPAQVPAGSGQRAIQMIGTWEIRSVVVVETSGPAPLVPVNGTQFVIGPDGIASIGGFTVDRSDLETVLGFPFDTYINQQDGRFVFYALGYDRLARGGPRDSAAVAGGSIDDNTIAVEQFNTNQLNTASPESAVRARYNLVRISNSILLPAAVEAPAAAAVKPTLFELLRGCFSPVAIEPAVDTVIDTVIEPVIEPVTATSPR